MKLTVEEIRQGISKFLEMLVFEVFDSTTIEFIEHQIGQCMKTAKIDEYFVRTTFLDDNSLKVNLLFDDNNIDFLLARGK